MSIEDGDDALFGLLDAANEAADLYESLDQEFNLASNGREETRCASVGDGPGLAPKTPLRGTTSIYDRTTVHSNSPDTVSLLPTPARDDPTWRQSTSAGLLWVGDDLSDRFDVVRNTILTRPPTTLDLLEKRRQSDGGARGGGRAEGGTLLVVADGDVRAWTRRLASEGVQSWEVLPDSRRARLDAADAMRRATVVAIGYRALAGDDEPRGVRFPAAAESGGDGVEATAWLTTRDSVAPAAPGPPRTGSAREVTGPLDHRQSVAHRCLWEWVVVDKACAMLDPALKRSRRLRALRTRRVALLCERHVHRDLEQLRRLGDLTGDMLREQPSGENPWDEVFPEGTTTWAAEFNYDNSSDTD